jgi:hypothetical protein
MSVDYLRYAGLPFEAQRRAFLDIIQADPLVRNALLRARDLDLPDWFVVSGALYNSVWNALTGRPSGYGMRDVDLFYFDQSDLSYEAEDKVIAAAAPAFAGLPVPVEIRNQARVHLWFPAKFGGACPRYTSSADAIRHFASKTHAVGVRLAEDGSMTLSAPFGLDDIFSFRVTPNHSLDNRATHEAKAARAKSAWPELTVVPWQ